MRKNSIQESLILIIFIALFASCSHSVKNQNDSENVKETISAVMPDTLVSENIEPESEPTKFHGSNEIISYIENLKDADAYKDGVIYSMAINAPEYAEKILNSRYDKFLVVDKARLMVILYDKYGHVIRQYDCACAKNYGTKHKKADSRTPEGYFSVEGIYNSTDWLFTDDDGVTSKKKGQFGPRFIRLRIPNTSQIGIHGTCAPWSMGHRVSHGCIRILNENILELVDLVEPGMPVIVLPGKRDRAVNRSEGYNIAYFPTDEKYAMSDAEKKEKVKPREEIEDSSASIIVPIDSISGTSEPINQNHEIQNNNQETPDSIVYF